MIAPTNAGFVFLKEDVNANTVAYTCAWSEGVREGGGGRKGGLDLNRQVDK